MKKKSATMKQQLLTASQQAADQHLKRIEELEKVVAAFMLATNWVGDTPRGEVIQAYQQIREVRAMVLKARFS